MPSALEEQLLEAQIADLRDNPPDYAAVLADEVSEVSAAGAGRGRAKHTKGAAAYPVYNTETGAVEYPPVSILARKIMEKRADGGRQWSLEPIKGYKYEQDPRLTAKFGHKRMKLARPKDAPAYWCPLSPKSEEWEEMKRLGFARPCPRSSPLADIESKMLHFEHRHNAAFRAKRRAEDTERLNASTTTNAGLIEILQRLLQDQKG